MRNISRRLIGASVAAVAVGAAVSAAGQTVGPQNPPLVIRSLVGRDSFEFYCASCHGRDGGGNGPVASALKMPPADLRILAKQNGGEFPRARVLDFVTNGPAAAVSAHGTSEMPVWGPAFRGLDRSDTLVDIRIANIVKHLESLQVK